MNQPPRIARWVLNHFGCSPNNEAVIGDLDERYRTGIHSAAWYWRQMFISLVVGVHTQICSGKGIYMKQAAKWALIVVGVFSIGFWAGRKPVIAPVQSPPLIDAARHGDTNGEMLVGTVDFLRMELDKAIAVNTHEQSPVSQQRVEDLQRKLGQAQEAMKLRLRALNH
jgi:hypothetical protein